MYGSGSSVEPVEPSEHVDEHRRQRVAVLVAQRRQVGQIRSSGRDLERDRERRRQRHPRAPRADDRRDRARVAGIGSGRHPPARRARLPAGHVVVGVDLPVGMGDRRADLGAAVLEHEHVVDVVAGAERGGALRPQVDHLAGAGDAERPEASRRGPACRARPRNGRRPSPAIGWGTTARRSRLGRLEPADAERASRRRQVRPLLPGADDVHDGAEHRIDADLGHRAQPEPQCRSRCRRGGPRPRLGTRRTVVAGRVELSPSARATTGWSVDARRGAVQVTTPTRAPRRGRLEASSPSSAPPMRQLSGRTPMTTAGRGRAPRCVAGERDRQRAGTCALRRRQSPTSRFIAGEPMKPATNTLAGRVNRSRGVAHCCSTPSLQHGDAVAHRHRLDLVVGDVHRGDAEPALEGGDLGAGLDAQLGVEVRQRLVHEEHLGMAHDAPAPSPRAGAARPTAWPACDRGTR